MNVNEEKDKISVIRKTHAPNELQQEGPPSTAIDTQTSLLTPEQIEEFFKATEDGSVERLEKLFNEKIINADPNMTYFTESLLMAAIRTNRNEVADYLIDQLAINVQYAAHLHEFHLRKRNNKIPIRHRTLSCRDLAYEKGMMELVDLIDMISNDVKPNIKRYLKNHLQTRLNNIHQAYLKRIEERNKHLLFQTNEEKEKENKELPTVNITDENIVPLSSMPPPITYRPYKSHIEETIQNIDTTTTKDKSIDETGKKTFRFSNYNLRFRLIETPNNKNNEQSQSKTTTPSLPTISLFALRSTPLITTNNKSRSISETTTNSRLSIRDTRGSVCRSVARTTLPQIVCVENKPPILSNRVNQNNIKYSYIPQQQHALYNQPKHFMPVTLKSTAIGLPSDTRIIRD